MRYKNGLGKMMRIMLYDCIALVLLAHSLLLFICLLSYNPLDKSGNTLTNEPIGNWLGASGAWTADFLFQWFGLGAFIFPIAFLSYFIFFSEGKFFKGSLWKFGLGMIFLSLFQLVLPWMHYPNMLSYVITSVIPFYIMVIILFSSLFIFILFKYKPWQFSLIKKILQQLASAKKKPVIKRTLVRSVDEAYADDSAQLFDKPIHPSFIENPIEMPLDHHHVKPMGKRFEKPGEIALYKTVKMELALPPLSLLKDHSIGRMDKRKEIHIDRLQEILEDFGVKGKVLCANPGPIVTLYELEPAAGVKSSRVISLADDIARSMSALSARVAVVSGKNVIGIELSNVNREMVYLKNLLASPEYNQSTAALALTLGKDISGTPVIADLTKMPHVLVAGTTGSGKSVGINSMILSLLYRLSPEQCRLIMIDPKMLELSVYDDIPHLLTPVITEPKKAILALKWVVQEMENRYRLMSQLGVRHIAGYNQRLQEAQKNQKPLVREIQVGFDEKSRPMTENQTLDLKPLPFIVVIVDEMADLMLVAGKELEILVQRLAQMARAAGIHIIMATQRPSVDVITGTIKANFPTRMSYQVTSKIDSRTILGEQGAEHLLGQGDMLYMAAGGRITRVHGPFVSDEEIEKVVEFLKEMGEPNYVDMTVRGDESSELLGACDGADSDLYRQAIDIIRRDRKPSISYIQRQLQIGYNRAARLMEQMEKEGVVSPPNHTGKREILG